MSVVRSIIATLLRTRSDKDEVAICAIVEISNQRNATGIAKLSHLDVNSRMQDIYM